MTTCKHELPTFDRDNMLSVTINVPTFRSYVSDYLRGHHNPSIEVGAMRQISLITTPETEGGIAVELVMQASLSGKEENYTFNITVEEFKKHITSALVASGDYGHLNIVPHMYDIASISLLNISFTDTMIQRVGVTIISPLLGISVRMSP